MNTIEELQQNLADALSQVEELKKQLEKEQQKPARKGRFIPNKGEVYYCHTSSGEIRTFKNTGHVIDLFHIYTGNCYKTQEEAERAVKSQKVRTQLRDLAEGFKPDWSDGSQGKWVICFVHTYNEYKVLLACHAQEIDSVYFETEEKALAAIKELGSDLDLLRE